MKVIELPLSAIRVSDLNTRKDLNAGSEDAGISELAESINEQGLINPIIVRETNDGSYELIAGQRRFLAFQKLGRNTISASIRKDLQDADATALSLVENVQRADMHPMDKAKAYQSLLDMYHSSQKVAKETGMSVSTINRYLKLLGLAPSIQETMSTAEGLAGVGTLSKLAETFTENEQESVLTAIEGFTQPIQLEILKRSEGKLDRIEELREQAMEGAFDLQTCNVGLCFEMPEEWILRIKKALLTNTDVLLPAQSIETS